MALKRSHLKLLKDHHFEKWAVISDALLDDQYDQCRVVYAITNPEGTEVVYVGETEKGRNVRSRLKAHLKDRDKLGAVEEDSMVYIHFMVTEYLVLSGFENKFGALPELNKRKSQKHVRRRTVRLKKR